MKNTQVTEFVRAVQCSDLSGISTVSYVQRYLYSYLDRIDDISHSYWSLLEAAGETYNKTVVDIGCGFGLLAMLAIYSGASRVIALDLDIEFVEAATKVSGIVGIPIEVIHKAAEDITDLKSESIDIVLSTDFIEHVYDLPDHFAKVYECLQPGGVYVARTSLNSYCVRSVRRFRKIHHAAEYSDFSERTGVQSYLSLRKEMIRKTYPRLSNENVNAIAKATRGWAKHDLLQVVEEAVRTGKIRRRFNAFNSNTCDPRNGYWPDRLLSPFEVLRYMKNAGFNAQLLRPYPGWRKRRGIRKALRTIRNWAIQSSPMHLIFAYIPGFTVVGKKVDTRRL